jgi:hypothetical protein
MENLDRATSMGYTIRAYHGTANEFIAFDIDKGNPSGAHGPAPYFSDDQEEAKGYADRMGENGKVLNCLLRIRKPLVIPMRSRGEYPTRKERLIPERLYRDITGGQGPDDSTYDREMTGYDALRHAREILDGDERSKWNVIYSRLREMGYDALMFPNTMLNFNSGVYTKIVMLDLTGIRLVNAEFDPDKSREINLLA